MKEKKIGNIKFGFRKLRSTIDAIFKITRSLMTLEEKKMVAIFFDIEKAHDEHITRTRDKAKKMGANKKTLRKVYSITCKSKLYFRCQLYSTTSQVDSKILIACT